MRENNPSLHFETLQLHAEQPLGIAGNGGCSVPIYIENTLLPDDHIVAADNHI